MRYTRLRVWIIFLSVVLCVILILNYATKRGPYKSEFPVTDSLVTATYPDLYQAISKRDAQALKPFFSSKSAVVRRQAWRAFANTPVDSLSTFIDLAQQQNSDVAWFAVSQHKFTGDQLRTLEEIWNQHPDFRTGIDRVLGLQGDDQSLDFLVSQLNNERHGNEEQFALAIGRLLMRVPAGQGQQIRILQRAFGGDNEQYTRAYLYGWYRGAKSKLTAAAQDTLTNYWRIFGVGTNTDVDQYVNKLMPERTTGEMVIYYNGRQQLDNTVQLSLELAKSIGKIPLDEDNSLAAKILLTSPNPHVQTQVLQSLEGKLNKQDELYHYISGTMIADSTLDNAVWLQALQTAGKVDSDITNGHWRRIDNIPKKNPYLWPRVFSVYEELKSADDYLNRVKSVIGRKDTLATMFALQSLQDFWQSLPDEQKTGERIKTIRPMVFNALGLRDRGVAYMTTPLFKDKMLFNKDDFTRINNALSAFSLPGDIEVYQAFGSLFKDRFEDQAKSFVDSLAAQDYAPLNRSLADAGWDVKVPEEAHPDFRMPNWKRLWQLGRHPVWRLKTAKGNIDIKLNTLVAPATVSVIDSLSRAGAYDGIPFHRVVPNFVIQGGDIERKDGFGGPDFVIPTEANEQGFVRGAAGIASAGTDTEGSQYFIMNQWKPHLNSHYTRFGEVIQGMKVVDRIEVGDKVLSTRWY
ncbi:MAG TPA: peptidylprolyl isomerase [Balneolaceae bacterium]|nr:peptidylprolyl isomerase [Balneolaceae bacterium]